MNDQIPAKKPRTRSPAYPAIDLEDAVAKAAALWEKLTRHWGAAATVVTFWGYEKDSSSGFSIISALIKFGLLEDKGSGENREVKLTDRAIRLVYQPLAESDDHKTSLKISALLPAIHAELWKKFTGELPHDSVIERYLVMDRGFNADYVKGFIKQFRKTIDFSGLKASDTINEDPSETAELAPPPSLQKEPPPPFVGPSAIAQAKIIPPTPQVLTSLPPDGQREILLPHPKGDITIKGPFPMTATDWTVFTGLISAFRPWLVKDDSPPTVPSPTE